MMPLELTTGGKLSTLVDDAIKVDNFLKVVKSSSNLVDGVIRVNHWWKVVKSTSNLVDGAVRVELGLFISIRLFNFIIRN